MNFYFFAGILKPFAKKLPEIGVGCLLWLIENKRLYLLENLLKASILPKIHLTAPFVKISQLMRPIPVNSGNETCPILCLFETDRLLLRELSPEDAEEFFLLNLDPDVIRFTGDPPFPNMVDARRFLENYDQYQKYGFGRWAVILKENREFIGWCGLKYSPELNGVDLGFRFFKKHWGKGYATEAAKGCIHYGFNHLGLTKIFGRAMKANKASLRVLEKAGLIFMEEIEFERHPGMFYSIEKKVASDII